MTMGAGINSIIYSLNNSLFIAQGAPLQMDRTEIIGTWIAGLLTICIFSFLYNDNPLYKFAEHLFVGVSAGYIITISYQNVIVPNLLKNVGTAYMLATKNHYLDWEKWSYLLAGIFGVMLILKLVPKVNWIARWPLSFMVGLTSGLGVVLTMEASVVKQIEATVVNLIVRNADGGIMWASSIQHWLIVVGVCCSLIYFYFSKEHKGLFFGTTSRIGIFILMMAFGAAFGYTVMARVSLLIGRMLFFRDEWWPAVKMTFGMQ